MSALAGAGLGMELLGFPGSSHAFSRAGWHGEVEADGVPDEVDYIVIGSGPGGSPVAANLAEAGYSVLVLEAGPASGNKTYYDVPALWARANDDPEVRWDYFVHHYTERRLHGSSFVPERDGVLYPRASTLGGCTSQHALFTTYPEHSDWGNIQQITGDRGWHPDRMWSHWERMRRWQSVDQPLPPLWPIDPQLIGIVLAALVEQAHLPPGHIKLSEDPNDRINVDHSAQGFFIPPQAILEGKRAGARERLVNAAARHPALHIKTNALVERILLEPSPSGKQRAYGVEYLEGRHLFQAATGYIPLSSTERRQRRRTVTVRKEVIVSGGTFNSPQILMLSGIGPAAHLNSMGIPVRVNLPGVGTNLQDRVEASVITQYENEFTYARDCEFRDFNDPCLAEWRRQGANSRYAQNACAGWIKRRYSKGSSRSELIIFGLPARFQNFSPNYDGVAVARPRNHWTWVILKAFAQGRAGYVRLASNDPTRMPYINKRSLGDGAGGDYDIAAIKEGIEVARRINRRHGGRYREISPGPNRNLKDYIIAEQFGHHASCTNPMGRDDDPMSVLDGQLKVRGTQNVRAVDASAFPLIPGTFIWASIGILAEKASRDILADAERHYGHARYAQSGTERSLG